MDNLVLTKETKTNKPLFGHKQLFFDQSVLFLTDIAQIHTPTCPFAIFPIELQYLLGRYPILCDMLDRARFIDQYHPSAFPRSS